MPSALNLKLVMVPVKLSELVSRLWLPIPAASLVLRWFLPALALPGLAQPFDQRLAESLVPQSPLRLVLTER